MTPSSKTTPTLSIIIPVYNCEKTIGKCIESLIDLDHTSYEIIIVNDGSTDNTAAICQSYQSIRMVNTTNGGPSRARNIGVEHARGAIVVFTDGDCIADRQWAKELESCFTDDTVAGAGGNQVSPPDETDFGQCVQKTFLYLGFATSYMKTHSSVSEIAHNPSCNSAYRKNIFQKAGGFDESLWPGEDVDLDYRLKRLGYTLMRNPEAIVKHYRPQSLSALGMMMQRYGASAYWLLCRYGFFRPLHYLPFILLFFVCIATVSLFCEPTVFIYLFTATTCLLLLYLIRIGFSSQTGTILIMTFVIIFNWHLGFFKQFFILKGKK